MLSRLHVCAGNRRDGDPQTSAYSRSWPCLRSIPFLGLLGLGCDTDIRVLPVAMLWGLRFRFGVDVMCGFCVVYVCGVLLTTPAEVREPSEAHQHAQPPTQRGYRARAQEFKQQDREVLHSTGRGTAGKSCMQGRVRRQGVLHMKLQRDAKAPSTKHWF